jgi:hypothetical protein
MEMQQTHCYATGTVTLLWKRNDFALSIVTATLTLLCQGNLTYAAPPRKPNMSRYIFFIRRVNFRQLPRTGCLFFVFYYRLNTLARHFTHLSYYCIYINVTRDAHTLIVRLAACRMQFSARLYNSKFSWLFHCCGRIELH